MFRYSDLETVRRHNQELYAEAERYRLLKNGQLEKQAEQGHSNKSLLVNIKTWITDSITQLGCAIQAWMAQGLSRGNAAGRSRLAPVDYQCRCQPEPCAE